MYGSGVRTNGMVNTTVPRLMAVLGHLVVAPAASAVAAAGTSSLPAAGQRIATTAAPATAAALWAFACRGISAFVLYPLSFYPFTLCSGSFVLRFFVLMCLLCLLFGSSKVPRSRHQARAKPDCLNAYDLCSKW